MGNKLKLIIVVTLIMLAFGISSAAAASGPPENQLMYFKVNDDRGDQTGTIDLKSVTFTFNNETGLYTIVWTATHENPFVGEFYANLNLFNPDTGTTAQDPSLFSTEHFRFNLNKPRVQLIVRGKNSNLQSWEPGDRVALSGPDPLGLPDGISRFRCGVVDFANPYPDNIDEIGVGQFVILEYAEGKP